ncbi:MAG: putative quinol monooxygenase [Planctomycetota bacterium]
MPLIIVAHIQAKVDQVDRVKIALEKLIPTTRAENGCVQYDLHQDHVDPTRFLFYEVWESRALWQAHMSAPHVAACLQAIESAVAEFSLQEMGRIGA